MTVSTSPYDLLSTCNALLFLCCTIITHQYHSEWDGFHSAPKGMQRIKITSVLRQSPQRCTLRTILDVPCLPTWQPFIYTYAVICVQWLQTYPVSVEEPWQCKLHKFRLLILKICLILGAIISNYTWLSSCLSKVSNYNKVNWRPPF